jgi:hypothetical protein
MLDHAKKAKNDGERICEFLANLREFSAFGIEFVVFIIPKVVGSIQPVATKGSQNKFRNRLKWSSLDIVGFAPQH